MRPFRLLSVSILVLSMGLIGADAQNSHIDTGPADMPPASLKGQLVGPKGANRKIVEARIALPAGYKKAWTDDRLNALRGVGTTSGKAQMQLVWSRTVPRYLIDPATGKRATR